LERLETLDRETLIRIILDQQRMIDQLGAEIEQLKGGRSSAAPFSKGTHKSNPKPPGRKPGQGFFRFRSEPEPAAGTEPVRVQVAGCCPECGGTLGEAREELVSTPDIPLERRAEVRCYTVGTRRCRQCGKSVRGRHPDVAEGQRGATAHRLGPRIKALAHVLPFAHGVPVRKTPAILEELTGVRLRQGAITQDAMKQAAGMVGARYEELRASVAEQPVVHTGDTGWRVGGRTACLMAFVNSPLAVYQIRNRHRNEAVRELVPAGFAGVMVCDRGKSYDATELADVAQQKCLAHLLRNAAEVAEKKTGRAKEFSQKLKSLLKGALTLRAARTGLDATEYRQQAEKLDGELTQHLRKRILRDDDNQRLLNGVGTQQDRGNLLRFLCQDGIEATNNRAERELRPAVIARKVSHCSRNERGARAFEAFTSVIQTLRKTTRSTIGAAFTNLVAPTPETSP
jgi:transposase